MPDAPLDENPHVLSFRVAALEKGMAAISQDMVGLKSATVAAAEQSSLARSEVKNMRADLAKDHASNKTKLNYITLLVPIAPLFGHVVIHYIRLWTG